MVFERLNKKHVNNDKVLGMKMKPVTNKDNTSTGLEDIVFGLETGLNLMNSKAKPKVQNMNSFIHCSSSRILQKYNNNKDLLNLILLKNIDFNVQLPMKEIVNLMKIKSNLNFDGLFDIVNRYVLIFNHPRGLYENRDYAITKNIWLTFNTHYQSINHRICRCLIKVNLLPDNTYEIKSILTIIDHIVKELIQNESGSTSQMDLN